MFDKCLFTLTRNGHFNPQQQRILKESLSLEDEDSLAESLSYMLKSSGRNAVETVKAARKVAEKAGKAIWKGAKKMMTMSGKLVSRKRKDVTDSAEDYYEYV
eukprot:m.101980 g.101980  ORF g.101980 m.101980 type:complete len:102 (+) comp37149_c0_seq3:286-591(+)